MSARRKDDPLESRSHFRTDRMVQERGNWYFLPGEGTVEGPFACRRDALENLDRYIRMANFDMLLEGSDLHLSP